MGHVFRLSRSSLLRGFSAGTKIKNLRFCDSEHAVSAVSDERESMLPSDTPLRGMPVARNARMNIFKLRAFVVSGFLHVPGFRICEFVGFAACVFLGRGRNSVVGFRRLRVLTNVVTRGFPIFWILAFSHFQSL